MTRLYGPAWDAISSRVIALSPQCSVCGKSARERYVNSRGLPKSTRLTVDHIRPVSQGGGNTADNLRVLCESCHGERTASNWRRRG